MNPNDLPVSPLENANILSKIFFTWLLDLFRLGSKRDIELSDFYRVSPNNKSEKLGNDLAHAWADQELKANQWNSMNEASKPKHPSLGKAVLNVFFWQFAVFGIFVFLDECVLKIGQSIFLGLIIRYFDGKFGNVFGYLFCAGLFLSAVLSTCQRHPYTFLLLQVGMKIRVACSTLIYRKALKLSQAAIGNTNVGQLVNLLSNDVKRLDVSVSFLHYLWVGPAQLAIVTYILWGYFGWPCLVGAAVLLLFVPLQGILGKLFGVLRLQVAEKTDKRIRIMSEIVNAVRTIKMYAWERPFAKVVGEAREEEIKCIRKTAYVRALDHSCFDVSIKVVTFVTLLTYVLTGEYLKSESVFVALSLYTSMLRSMTHLFPLAIAQFAEAVVSIRRLENFLLMEERDMLAKPTEQFTKINDAYAPRKSKKRSAIIMTNLNARWSGASNTDVNVDTLRDISMNVSKGQLVAVVGAVGSGKTSLLQVLLYELPYSSGGLEIKGKLAYASQDPWIFSGSIRDNIVFGRDYEYNRFHAVIEACALAKDMELLSYRDQTLVGERGITLSGGQKARVNLARAVYADADIYLLDDPLSAVDAEVAKHIFEHCIMGLLKEKATVLVTHQLQFLKSANEIILLNKGRIEARGNFEKLLETGINFTQALQTDDSPVSKSPSQDSSGIYAVQVDTTSSHKSGATMSSFQIEEQQSLQSASNDFGESKPLLPQQHRETISRGEVGLKLCWRYISAGASCFGLFLLIVSNILVVVLFSGSDYWLKYWTKLEENRTSTREPFLDKNSSSFEIVGTIEYILYGSGSTAAKEPFARNRMLHVYIYCALVASLFMWLFKGVMGAAMRFFEINPVGRVLNRFSKDIGVIDEMLPQTLFYTIWASIQVIGVFVIVSIINPYLVIPSLLLPVVIYYVRKFYLKTAKSVRHLEAIAKSPVFSHLSTSLHGLSTIRAMGVESQFEKQFDDHQDLHTASWIIYISTARWLGVVVEWSSTLYIGVVVLVLLLMKGENSAPGIGLSIASAMSLTGMVQWGVRQSAEAENQMVSVERVQEYAQIEPEGELESSPDNTPPSTWPSYGEIVFRNVDLQYGDDPPVLKHITCVFKSYEKVGIVGRTGSGKSSLITALFRVVNPCHGDIEIDGLSILQIGLHDLRKKISIIPQDPVLFNNTLRKNLDPFGDYTDDELWSVLEHVYLADSVRESPAGLYFEIAEGGTNFSVGQRQLICLGRAILRKNKILVLDEATANVDHETDALIQQTIRKKFATCTVLTIAHRLHTVMDSDRILVLDAGEIKEFDEPYNLLCNYQSALTHLVNTTGKNTADKLYKIAKLAHNRRIKGTGSADAIESDSAETSSMSSYTSLS